MDNWTQLIIVIGVCILFILIGILIENKFKSNKLTSKKFGRGDKINELAKFEEVFTKAKEKFLVFKPDFSRPNSEGGYGYFHLKGYDEWNFDKDVMERKFLAVTGVCKECNKEQATVGYFDGGLLKGYKDHNVWEIPDGAPEALCKRCAYKKIYPLLLANPKYFEAPIPPYGGDGIYTSSTLEES